MFYGHSGVSMLQGMFAFVFHDKETNNWIAARDPFGIKPLYYCSLMDELIFASEIKPFTLHPDITIARDNKSLREYS